MTRFRGPADALSGVVILLLGVVHTAVAIARGSMNLDGVAYLDVGQGWWTGDWPRAINTVWGPLYPMLVGSATLPSVPVEWRLPVVQLTNLLIFFGAYLAFRSAWSGLGTARERGVSARPGSSAIPDGAWWVVGHCFFAWATLVLIEIWSVTPDMLLAALLFLASALFLDQWTHPGRRGAFGFGVVLGLAGLCRSVMFPAGLLMLGIAAWGWTREKGAGPGARRLTGLGVASLGFALIVVPWVVTLSVRSGEPTWGEAGRITYMRTVNDVSYPFWEDPGSTSGSPEHAAGRLSEGPTIWAFGDEAVGGTYPPGFDPAYWYRGVSPTWSPRRQVEELAGNSLFTFDIAARRLGLTLGALLVLLWLSRPVMRDSNVDRKVAGRADLVAVGAMGFVGVALHLPVLVEARFIAAFLVLIFGAALALVRVPADRGGGSVAVAGSVVMVAGLALEIGGFNLSGAARVADFRVEPRGDIGFGTPAPYGSTVASTMPAGTGPALTFTGSRHAEIARVLNERGIGPGSRIAVIGDPSESFWARLSGVSIVAEISDEFDLYWGADEARRAELDAAFEYAGASVIVAEVRPEVLPPGWESLGEEDPAILRIGRPREDSP